MRIPLARPVTCVNQQVLARLGAISVPMVLWWQFMAKCIACISPRLLAMRPEKLHNPQFYVCRWLFIGGLRVARSEVDNKRKHRV